MRSYRLEQVFRYHYSAPIERLDHRLVVVPPAVHGDQRRRSHGVEVAGARARAMSRRDRFGNYVVLVKAPVVEEAIEFRVRVEVDRDDESGPAVLPGSALADRRYTRPTALTAPDRAIATVARELSAGAQGALDLADRISGWVHRHMHYSFGHTGVRTTAGQALALGTGVCQDYAHVMLAIARACGLAARYVSGHLVGEGGSHAWVEVMAEDAHHGRAVAVAFDPTHDRRAGRNYLTVATGRDYADVAPTSGTYANPADGRLSCHKRLAVADEAETELAS